MLADRIAAPGGGVGVMVVCPTPKESPATLRDQELSLRDIASRLVISKGNGRVGLPGRSDYWTVELIISKSSQALACETDLQL